MEEELDAIFEMIATGAARIHPLTHQFLRVNHKLAAMTGYTVEELLEMTALDLTHPHDRITYNALWTQALHGKASTFSLEKRYLRKDGAPLWVHATISLIVNYKGKPISAISLIQESTEQVWVGGASRKVQEWQSIALDAAKICTWEMDSETLQGAQPDRLARVVGFALPQSFPETVEYFHEEDREAVLEVVSTAIETGKPFQIEFRMVNPTTNAIVWMRAQGILVQNSQENQPRLIGIAQNITERKQMEEALQRSHADLESRVSARTAQLAAMNDILFQEITERNRVESARQHLLQRLVSAQEDERRRIARDLHDSLGQLLVALHLGLKSVQERPNCPGDIIASIQRLREQALSIDDAVDRLAFALRPPALDDLGLQDALHWHVREWGAASGVDVDLHVQGLNEERLLPEIETTIYRIVQEALTNILKHAAATHVSLIVERRRNEVLVIIEDNGHGFDWESVQHTPSVGRAMGLQGMVERATLVGGRIEIEAALGAGATIYLHLPLANKPSDGGTIIDA